MIRRGLTALLVAASLTAGMVPAAQARDGYRGGYDYRGSHHDRGWRDGRRDDRHGYRGYDRDRRGSKHRHNGKSRDYSDEILIGAGIVGLAIVAGSMIASSPREPDIQWSDAPQRASNCETDEVYRYLPDGSIQYGDRTRCY